VNVAMRYELCCIEKQFNFSYCFHVAVVLTFDNGTHFMQPVRDASSCSYVGAII